MKDEKQNQDLGKSDSDCPEFVKYKRYQQEPYLEKVQAFLDDEIELKVIRTEMGYPTGANIASDIKKFLQATTPEKRDLIVSKIEEGKRSYSISAFIFVMHRLGHEKEMAGLQGLPVGVLSATPDSNGKKETIDTAAYPILSSVIQLGSNCQDDDFDNQAKACLCSVTRAFAAATKSLVEAVLSIYLLGVLIRHNRGRILLISGKSTIETVADKLPDSVCHMPFPNSEGSIKTGLSEMEFLLKDRLNLESFPKPQDPAWKKVWSQAGDVIRGILDSIELSGTKNGSFVLRMPQGSEELLSRFPGLSRMFNSSSNGSISGKKRTIGRISLSMLCSDSGRSELLQLIDDADPEDRKELCRKIGLALSTLMEILLISDNATADEFRKKYTRKDPRILLAQAKGGMHSFYQDAE
jgi:hypothetical protein